MKGLNIFKTCYQPLRSAYSSWEGILYWKIIFDIIISNYKFDIIIEKLNDDKIRITLSREDLVKKDIDIAIKTEAAPKLYKRPILVTKQTLNQAANELRAIGKKFDFSGKEVAAQEDTTIPPLYSIYNNKIGEVL